MKHITLTQGKMALVDDVDYAQLSVHRWRAVNWKGNWYAARIQKVRGHGRLILMHREIMDAPPDMLVDHQNGNGLVNLRSNLRLCTNSQNQANRRRLPVHALSVFRGVTYHRGCNRWQAQIKVQGRGIYLGLFNEENAAARAYDAAAAEYFGEFARPNFQYLTRAA
jgi:hypothetical protein